MELSDKCFNLGVEFNNNPVFEAMKINENILKSFQSPIIDVMKNQQEILGNLSVPFKTMSELPKFNFIDIVKNQQEILDKFSTINNNDIFNIGKMFSESNFFSASKTVSESVLRYGWVDDNLAKTIKSFSVSDLTEQIENIAQFNYEKFSEIAPEVISDAFEVLQEDQLNIEQKIMKKFENFRVKHPLFAVLFIFVLQCIILQNIINFIPNTFTAITTKITALRESPVQSSKITTTLSDNTNLYVINKTHYYYKIIFNNPDTNETQTGWVSKRSIKLSDNDSIPKENSTEDNQSD